MRLATCLVVVAALWAATCVAAQAAECRISGDKIHWIADHCMAELETDDEIAASECIGEQLKKRFPTDCAAKLHYKKKMCERAISAKRRPDDLEGCLADRQFMGATVRDGGVGGRRP
jgi:hypothetical protein